MRYPLWYQIIYNKEIAACWIISLYIVSPLFVPNQVQHFAGQREQLHHISFRLCLPGSKVLLNSSFVLLNARAPFLRSITHSCHTYVLDYIPPSESLEKMVHSHFVPLFICPDESLSVSCKMEQEDLQETHPRPSSQAAAVLLCYVDWSPSEKRRVWERVSPSQGTAVPATG